MRLALSFAMGSVPAPDTYRGQYRGDDAGERYATYIETAIEELRTFITGTLKIAPEDVHAG